MRFRVIFAMLFTVLALPASAMTVTLTGDVDGRIRNVDGILFDGSTNPILDPNNNEVFLNSNGLRTNTILEFDLSFLLPGQSITAIDMSITDIAAANTLFVNGYSGNGTLEGADGLESANDLGLFAITTGSNGPLSLSTAFANSLIGSGTYLGLNIGVINAQTDFSFSDFSVTFTLTPVPAVPIPAGGLLLISALGVVGLARRRRRS